MVKNAAWRERLGLARSAGPLEAAPSGAPDSPSRRTNDKSLAAGLLRQIHTPAVPLLQWIGLGGRGPTLAECATPWFAYWSRELGLPARPNRYQWEQIAVLQAFYEADVLKPGARVLGLGVGREPLPSYLASLDMRVVASDLDGVADPELVFDQTFLTRDTFDARVEVSNIDMRRLDDPTLRNLDGCWSCGVLNDMASLHQAEEAVIQAMDVLRPGGVAVHIAQMALEPALQTTNDCGLLPMSFFETVAAGLAGRGHTTGRIDLCLGRDPLDAYVDDRPEPLESGLLASAFETDEAPDLKFYRDGRAATSFAIIARRRP